jgi:hypothetical protein
VTIVLAVLALGVLAHGVRSVTGAHYDTLFNNWIYNVLMWAGVALCAARCLVAGGERLAWGFMAASMGFWAAGDLAWTCTTTTSTSRRSRTSPTSCTSPRIR